MEGPQCARADQGICNGCKQSCSMGTIIVVTIKEIIIMIACEPSTNMKRPLAPRDFIVRALCRGALGVLWHTHVTSREQNDIVQHSSPEINFCVSCDQNTPNNANVSSNKKWKANQHKVRETGTTSSSFREIARENSAAKRGVDTGGFLQHWC